MNAVETILKDNIDNPNSLFIFPTDISASRWADHLLRLKGGSIAMNKFIAWDEFKRDSIKSRVQDKKSIPSALRKIFVSRLVNENAQAVSQGGKPLFTSLIREKWAAQSSQFTPWLAKILPQLGALLKNNSISEKSEGDFLDMFNLARRYSQFLEEYGLFEPAWETPPFKDEGKECFLFFPESLNDYGEYEELLSSSPHVKIIKALGTDALASDTFFYTNSRREITEAALYIRDLNEKQNIKWDSIAVCIPDSQDYEPYVIREFKNRNIPFVKRTGKALSEYPAGSFFRSALDCASQDFSFSSLVALVMNKNLPWKDTDKIDKLIKFGIENNCLYSWSEEEDGKQQHVNVWEDAFKKPLGGFDIETKNYFENLKNRLYSLKNAPSFGELRKQYFIFREHFLDMIICPPESDLILSRCISELMNLCELEKDFPNVPAPDPLRFFSDYLTEVSYLAQQKTSGVAILPYKTAAAAPFDCHIILGAGQDSISVIHSRLDFLPRKKREELGFSDRDASADFINLHKFNSVKKSAFFCSEHTFKSYTIPHAKIGAPSESKERYMPLPDYYALERDGGFDALHENQKLGFTAWKNRREKGSDGKWGTNSALQEHIRSIYGKEGKYRVSASSMADYFQCSLIWLFNRVFSLENVQAEASFMPALISGEVYHAVLHHFFTEIKNKNQKLAEPVDTENGKALPQPYRELLAQSIDKIFDLFPILDADSKTKMSALTARMLRASKKDFQHHLEECLSQFLCRFAGYGIAGSEKEYTLDKNTFFLKGKIDCLLERTTPDGGKEYVIVDFKLKNPPKFADCSGESENGLSDFQLPMYITLTEENKKVKVYTAMFYSILDCKSEVIIGEEGINRESEEYKKLMDEFNKRMQQFYEDISSGNFSAFESESKNCLDCNYRRICRTVYTIDRKKNLSRGTSNES
jgi:hypothetical protein